MSPLEVVMIAVITFVILAWGITRLFHWISKVVDKQQEISRIKAQAMKTAAENGQRFEGKK